MHDESVSVFRSSVECLRHAGTGVFGPGCPRHATRAREPAKLQTAKREPVIIREAERTMTSSPLAAVTGERPAKQRRRLLSSSEAQELTAQRRTGLLADARSHGPYAWTNDAVCNALLWFQTTPPSAASTHDVPCGGAFDLLRSLLQNPGVAEARPARPRRTRLERAEGGGEGGSTYQGEEDYYSYSGRRPRPPKRPEAPIREILVGYASFDCADASAPPSAKKAAAGRRRPLRSDLGEIATARCETHELYKTCVVASEVLGGGGNDTAGCRRAGGGDAKVDNAGERNLNGLARNDLCLAVLDKSDEYFRLPGTAVAIAYASELYDCVSDFELGSDNLQKVVSLDGDKGGDATASSSRLTDASQQLLEKLGMLALSNRRAIEVYGLLLLEPVRRVRLPFQQTREDSPTVRDSKSGIIVSPSDIDNACSSRLCAELCQKFLIFLANDDRKGKSEGTNSISWLDLPSPLLCAISHAYFPFALEYVRYLLQRVIHVHIDMPRIVAKRVLSSMSLSNEIGGKVGNADVEMAEARIQHRLLALLGTSDRLCSLVMNELDRLEDQEEIEVNDGGDEQTKRLQEKKKEALRAVREALEPGWSR